jgi:hypothetical protein
MKIKKFKEFLTESQNGKSLGEWIESYSDDEYVMNIVNRHIGEISPDIRLSNAVNTLDEVTQKEIKAQVDKYLQGGIEEKDPTIVASTETENLLESMGSGVFTSFLKCLTALGGKEIGPKFEKTPENFLIFYVMENLESSVVRDIFKRFKSLHTSLEAIDYRENNLNLYFGVKSNGFIEYGVGYEQLQPIGEFKLSNKILKNLITSDLKAISNLKKLLVNLTFNDIITLGVIKGDMMTFSPGYFESKGPITITDRVISFSWKGAGKWDNGKFDEGELANLKGNFNTFVLSKKWGEKILVSIKPGSFWLNIHIKLK